MLKGIRTVDVDERDGVIRRVRLVFGPHYYVELHLKDSDNVEFVLGATHHGFHADASAIDGELEKIIYEVRAEHPGQVTD